MKDFEFIDFAKKRRVTKGMASITNNRMMFSLDESREIREGGFGRLRVGRNKLTGEVFLVACNDEDGMSLNTMGKYLYASSRELVTFLRSRLGSKDAVLHFRISENLSKTTEFITYKVL